MNKAYLINQLNDLAANFDLTFDNEVLSKVIDFSQFKVFPKGTTLQSIDDDAVMVGIVLDGLVRCYYIDSNGNDITRGFIGAGKMCMDESIIGYSKYICMWETLEESTLMLCEASKLRELILGSEKLKTIWIELLESALRYKLYRENQFLTENASERYLHFKKMYSHLSKSISQKHIATYLGITPEALSRIKRTIKDD